MLGWMVKGLDDGGHWWVVLSDPTDDGMIVVVNFTTHRPGTFGCSQACTVVEPKDHPGLDRPSCLRWRAAHFTPAEALRSAIASRKFPRGADVPAGVLRVLQDACAGSIYTEERIVSFLLERYF